MSKRSLFCLLALAAFASYAAGLGLKPGLWEVKIVKQAVDGRDMTAQIAASAEKMQQMMANTTTQSSGQTRNFHSESEMHYLGPDCGDVKPVDAPK